MLDCMFEQCLLYKKKEGRKERREIREMWIYLYPSPLGGWELTIVVVD